MTHLRKIMLEELQRRHYSEATTQLLYPLRWKDSRNTSTALRTAWARRAHSGVPGPTLHGAEAVTRHGNQPSVCPAVFLHPDTEEAVEHYRHSVP